MNIHQVTFASDGLNLAAQLHEPDVVETRGAIVLTGPFSNVKEQVPATYAERLAKRGFTVLTFDHRRWGASEGEPRQHEDTGARVSDLRDAVSYLTDATGGDVPPVGVVGICFGAVSASIFAAFDPRVRALALIGGSYNRPDLMRERFGPATYDDLMEIFAHIARRQFASGEVVYWPAADPAGMPAGMPGPEPWEYYGTERGACPEWVNRCTALSVKEELTISAFPAYSVLATPTLIVHGSGDQAVPISDAESAIDLAVGPTKLVPVETSNHIDLYDRDDAVEAAVAETAAWFEVHLQ